MAEGANRIDVHHHIFPPEWVKATAERGISDAGGVTFPGWSAESALALMDRKGIATAIVSLSAPGPWLGDDAEGRRLARISNEMMARLASEHPGRFGGFAALPLPDVDGALEEMAYALDTLKLDGVGLMTSYQGRYLGDPAFEAIFAELDRRKVPVFVHPEVPETSRDLKLTLPGFLVEFTFDTTRAVANLIYSGTMERYPNLKLILPHAGGTIPYLAGRLAIGALFPELNEKAPKGSLAYLRRFYYETALSTAPTALASLRELADPARILFGSDNPYAPEPLIKNVIQGLDAYAGFEAKDRAAIERENALVLFPRLAAVAGVRG